MEMRNRFDARAVTLLSAVLVLGCNHEPTQPAAAPDDVVGCYEVELGAWSGPHEAWDPPEVVVLMDSLGTFVLESGKHLVRPCPGDTTVMHYMAWWERPSADSLTLVFTTGYVGIQGRLGRDGAQWTGHAEAFTDVAPFVQATATLSLRALPPLSGVRATDRAPSGDPTCAALSVLFPPRASPSRIRTSADPSPISGP